MKWSVLRDFILTLSIWKVCICTDFAEHQLVDEIHESKIENMIHNSETPDLNEEEMYSDHMPSGLMCDGCLAVAYQLSLGFNKTQSYKPTKRLPESDIIDATESVCEGFEEYGIKMFKETKHLNGPGMPASEAPGMVQAGAQWPHRLQTMCAIYVDDFGDEEIYDAYRNDKTLVETLCHGKGIYGHCVDMKDKEEL